MLKLIFSISNLIKNGNAPPQDIAKLTFYQFIQSSHGSDLLDMLCLAGQPSPEQWSNYATWWQNAKHSFDSKIAKVNFESLSFIQKMKLVL